MTPLLAAAAEQVKMLETKDISDLADLAPLLALLVAAIGGLGLAMALPRERQRLVAAWVATLHVVAAGAAAGVWAIGGFRSVMGGTYAVDGLSLALTAALGISGAVCVALLRPAVAGTDREGELYAMLAATTLAAAVVAGASDLALLALSISLLSIGSFVMTGYLRRSRRGNEAAIKYYVYGTVTAAVMVYGLTWWYGLAGSTRLAAVGAALPGAPTAVVIASSALVVVGLGYKAAVVPFHFWTPDVYAGAPAPVAAYLSVPPKLAGVAALARFLLRGLPGDLVGWSTAIAVLAAVTMVFGVLAMIAQRDAIRLLAYSSISQTGFMLLAVAALPHSPAALRGLIYFFFAYAASNLAAFAVVIAVRREAGSADLGAFAGLGRRHPWWTAALVLSLLSLFGLPPLTGFVAKLAVFTAAIDAGQAWLAVVGIAATVISLYPYLRLIAPAVLNRTEPRLPRGTRSAGRPLATALVVSTLATVGFGLAAQPLLAVGRHAAILHEAPAALPREGS